MVLRFVTKVLTHENQIWHLGSQFLIWQHLYRWNCLFWGNLKQMSQIASQSSLLLLILQHTTYLLIFIAFYLKKITPFFLFLLICLPFWTSPNICQVEIVSFHAIKATEYKKPFVLIYNCLMECSTARRHAITLYQARPGVRFKAKFVDVVKTIQSQIYSAKNEHGTGGGTSGMSIPTVDLPWNPYWFKPNLSIDVKNWKIVEGNLTIPTSKNIHEMLICHSGVSKTNLRLYKNLIPFIVIFMLHQQFMLLAERLNLFNFDRSPRIGTDWIRMHVAENVSLIPTPIHQKLVEIANKRVICARCWCIFGL